MPRFSQPTKNPSQGRLSAIFSKQPLPGTVKTRLSPPLTPEQAAQLAEAMLRDAIERLALGEREARYQTALWYAPESAGAWFRGAAAGWQLHPQVGAGLGERMARAFDEGLAQPGVSSMVAIGSDQPLIGRGRLEEAHLALEQGADLVLGPDAGGGYYLIGLAAPQPELLTEVPMSSASMFDQTLARAAALGLRTVQLECGYDVDEGVDLERLGRDLAAWANPQHPDFPRHTQTCMQAWPAPWGAAPSHG